MNAPFARQGGGSGTNLRCDLCRKSFRAVDGYFRCNDVRCDYDICKNCATIPPAPVPANEKRCSSGHTLHFKTTAVPRKGARGQRLCCDICRKSFICVEGYYRCNHSCDYDICNACGSAGGPVNNVIKCSQGHPVQLFRPGEAKRRNTDGITLVYRGDMLKCKSCR